MKRVIIMMVLAVLFFSCNLFDVKLDKRAEILKTVTNEIENGNYEFVKQSCLENVTKKEYVFPYNDVICSFVISELLVREGKSRVELNALGIVSINGSNQSIGYSGTEMKPIYSYLNEDRLESISKHHSLEGYF